MKAFVKILGLSLVLLFATQNSHAQYYNPYQTNVFVNGYQLDYQTLSTLQMLIGQVPAGYYYMDQQGNFGMVGYQPVVNLYALAQQAYGYNQSGASYSGGSNSDFSYNRVPGSAGVHMREGNNTHYSNWNTGTSISSDGKNSVISVDGKVLNLPPY